VGLVNTLSVAAFVDVLQRRMPEALDRAGQMIALADEHAYPYYRAIGLILRGVALTALEGGDAGIGLVREGLAAHQAAETWQNHATYLVLLAEALGDTARIHEAHAALDDAERVVARTAERYCEAELHRIRGRLLQRSGLEASAEACFARAIDIARRQDAKFWELRASTSLARLWQEQGRPAEARQLLSAVRGWFSEGAATVDVREADAVLTA
jgi:predicted ATPase